MKKNILWIFLFFWTGIFVSSLLAEENWTVHPKDDGRALINPGMGWTMHFYSNIVKNYGSRLEPSDSLDWFEGCSTIYLRLPWAFIEPEEGKFNWAIVDTPAQRWIRTGKKVAFRFTTSESWLEYATPKWVETAGAKMVRYKFGEGPVTGGPLCDPVYDDPIFIKKLENFLAAAGKRYNGNPNIAFIDVGTFGTWGEGHTGFASRLTPSENARMAKIHIDLHLKYFPNTFLCISDDVIGPQAPGADFPLMKYCVEKGVSLRDDSILVQPAPNSWFHAELAGKFWPTLPVILEHEHYRSSLLRKAWNDELLLRSVEEYHASYMSIHWFPEELWKERADIVKKINRRLGYRIQLIELSWPKKVVIGKDFKVTSQWRNAGVAPVYQGGFMTLTLKDDKGGLVAVLSEESFDFKDLKVDAPEKAPIQTIQSTFCAGLIAPVTKPGTYHLYVSVGRRDGTPCFELPLPDSDGQKRYKVGTIVLE